MREQWVSEDGKVLVTFWQDGTVTVATRETRYTLWGPPVTMHLEEYGD